jgi:isocitrate/isopropylmalate dehydrogenase
MPYRIVLLPGDGIGVEVMGEARRLLEELAPKAGVELMLEEIPCGGRYYLAHPGGDWPEGSEERCTEADLILLAAVGWPDPSGKGPVSFPDGRMAGHSAVLGNRRRLELYANVRPVRLLPGISHRIHGQTQSVWRPEKVDFVIVRENTEGLYAGIGGSFGPASRPSGAVDTRVVTRATSERVIRYAFELARRRQRGAPRDGRRRLSCISKSNVLWGCRLFTEVFREVAMEYADIETEETLLDAFTVQLVTEPERFDVCVTTNLFGDVLTDLAAALQGGVGMAAGGNIGEHHAMFEPVHGSAPMLPPGRANPMAMLLATGAGLRWLGERGTDKALLRFADAISAGVAAVVARGAPLTADLVGEPSAASTSEVATAVRHEVTRMVR